MSKYLEVIWANTHNLKNIDVKIPKDKLVVITWVSGSWKSSLAFNTIYSEGKKKYLESLSTYARMFIWGMKEEADVREINGLSPTISIDQKTVSHNPRSTVWTITEIADFYKLLFLHLWDRKCVVCWNDVRKDTIWGVVDELSGREVGEKFMVMAPILRWEEKSFELVKKTVLNLWFIRFSHKWTIYTINDNVIIDKNDDVYIVVDRLVIKDYSDDNSSDTKRLKDSLELSFKVWEGLLEIIFPDKNELKKYSNVFVCSDCWHVPEELNISSFSFNSHHWACPDCHGLWEKMIFLEEKVIKTNLTLNEWAILPFGFGNYYLRVIEEVAKKYKFDLDTVYSDFPQKIKDLILYWTWEKKYKVVMKSEDWSKREYNTKFEGVINTLTRRFYENEWDSSKYSEYTVSADCPSCEGYRLKKESLSIFISWKNIWELLNMPVDESLDFFKAYSYPKNKEKVVKWVMKNILERLEFLSWVGLPYITLSRRANTLSGWEGQRIRLATQIWTKLEWIIYILDEPSIGLHPRDNDMLIENLKKLRDVWNTLIVVEHDEDIMHESDHIIDVWPWAWVHGWNIVFEWTIDKIKKDKKSITWPYLKDNSHILVDKWSRQIDKKLSIIGAKENNLKEVNVDIPLSNLVTVTGVSWSWKSSLVNSILAPYLANNLNWANRRVWKVSKIKWLENLDKVVIIDQSPIWRTPRSNPATYTWVFTNIREVFAETEEAKIRWYLPGRFSFNTRWGRCDSCDWDGVKKVEMHFLPSVYVTCDACKWKRYNKETLQVKYKWKTISDVLEMTVEESLQFFSSHPKIVKFLSVLETVWLWYIRLGQSSTTLSWWEAQRIKLATELSKRSTWKTFYILDEPTTGLHFQDVEKLLKILHSLVDKWNTVLVIEHNMDVIMNSDQIIDIWPEGWISWWKVVWTWTISEISDINESYTWKAIKKYMNKKGLC